MNLSINDFELYDCIVNDDNREYILLYNNGNREWIPLDIYDENKNVQYFNNIDCQTYVFNQPILQKKKRGRPKKNNDEKNFIKKSRGRPKKTKSSFNDKTSQEKKRAPSKYNTFIKEKTKQLKELLPNMDNKTRFNKILKMWNEKSK